MRDGAEAGRVPDLLELLLLAAREVEHLFCALEEHGALGLRLGDVEAAGEDGDLALLDLLHVTW